MKRSIKIYIQCVKISISSIAAYRLNFFSTLIITFLNNLLIPLLMILAYQNGASIPGYNFNEILLIQSVFMLCTGVCAPFLNNFVWTTMDHIRNGTYDILLLKPGSVVFNSIASSFEISSIGTFISGLFVFIYSLSFAKPDFINILQFIFLFMAGILVELSFILLMAATTFKFVGNGRIFEIYNTITTYGRYPTSIYKNILPIITTYIVPVSMLGFFPASALLGKSTPDMYAAIFCCILLFIFSILVFNRMISSYPSAGG
jgi:ABC-2 type transport system permease protein